MLEHDAHEETAEKGKKEINRSSSWSELLLVPELSLQYWGICLRWVTSVCSKSHLNINLGSFFPAVLRGSSSTFIASVYIHT
jgi:hypothetical protein